MMKVLIGAVSEFGECVCIFGTIKDDSDAEFFQMS